MDAVAYRWSDVEQDNPIPLLLRRRIFGEQMLLAKVELIAGCDVAPHAHVSEQIAIIISGRVRWFLGEEGKPKEMGGGEVLHLPSNFKHGLLALEDTLIFDVLSPPAAMGVDSQIQA